MIWTLFLHDLRENRMLLLFFTFIIFVYTSISVYMFDPESTQAMQDLLDLMPETMINMMGFTNLGTELTSYISNYLYGFILIIFPLIFIIMMGNKLISRHVDTGSMQFILTTPYSRIQVVVTQVVFYVISILFVIGINILILIAMAQISHPGALDIWAFARLNYMTISIHLLMGSITFFFGVLLQDNSRVIGLSGGFLFLQFVLSMIARIDESLSFLKYTTVFSMLDVTEILANVMPNLLQASIVLYCAVGLFVASIIVFNKKSLII